MALLAVPLEEVGVGEQIGGSREPPVRARSKRWRVQGVGGRARHRDWGLRRD